MKTTLINYILFTLFFVLVYPQGKETETVIELAIIVTAIEIEVRVAKHCGFTSWLKSAKKLFS